MKKKKKKINILSPEVVRSRIFFLDEQGLKPRQICKACIKHKQFLNVIICFSKTQWQTGGKIPSQKLQ